MLKRRVWKYIRNTLTKPQPKLDGLSICPYARQYLDKIQVVETTNWEAKVSQVCELFDNFDYEAFVICGPWEDYDELLSIVDDYSSRHWKKDIEILLMHPDTDEPPLPLEYNFPHCPLVIVQRHSTLEDAREQLENTGKYYRYYK